MTDHRKPSLRLMPAIPTLYKGIQFRSRLEAKWAAFFDLIQVAWSYEPVDFHGWIPDFRINDALLDVKPWREFDRTIQEKIEESGAPIDKSYVLADEPFIHPLVPFVRQIGWRWSGAPLLLALRATGGNGYSGEYLFIDLYVEDKLTAFPACGFYDEGQPTLGVEQWDLTTGVEIEKRWADACNQTQWRPH